MRTTRRQGTTRRLGARAAAVALAAAGLLAPTLAPHAGAATSSRSSGRLVISTVKSARFGTILVSGTTVYTLKANCVACAAKCLKYWPEVLLPAGVAHATAGPGVSAAKLGTIKRGARLQVTYGGKALYWFSKDTAPGQVKGNVKDTWGSWSVVVTKPLGSGSTTTTAPAGGGGGGGAGF